MLENSSPVGTSDREIVTTRLFDAPRDLVFGAWTSPEHLARWWGPRGFTTTTHSFDFRPGGAWVLTMHGPNGMNFENRIVYEEILRPARIVFAHEPGGFRATVTFAEEGGRTRVVLHHVFRSAPERDAVIQKFHADEGAKETLERLAEHVGGKRLELNISRTFDAPRRLVWDAWTKAEHVARWFTPRPLTTPQCEVDFRPGGTFRIVMRMPDGADHAFDGNFGEIVELERLTFNGRLPDGNEVGTLVTFADEAGGKTKLTVCQRYSFESQSTRGAQQGWTATLNQLAAHVSGPA